MSDILEVENLSVAFNVKKNNKLFQLKAVDNVSISIKKGEMLGIIGESGSGKSTLAFGILNLIDAPGRITDGKVLYINQNGEKQDLLQLSVQDTNKYRWKEIATVFQAAQSALNPIITIWEHFKETYETHKSDSDDLPDLRKHVLDLIQYVRLSPNVLDMYPFELSGGMKQRILIALSLLLNPEVIILDEPTTALDVITQWYILDILKKINKEKGITIVFLTHDISIVSSMVDRICVMYAGQIVELGSVKEVIMSPGHPYTKALLNAIPTLEDNLESRHSIKGETYNMLEVSDECRFKNRCQLSKIVNCDGRRSNCDKLFDMGEEHFARCKYALNKQTDRGD